MTRPRKGGRITAEWASGLQVRDALPLPPEGTRTPAGVAVPSNALGSIGVLAKNGATELDPWTLVGLTTLSPAVTEDGRLRLQVRTDRSKMLATTGPATVPANGWFTPIFFDLMPMRVKAVSTDYWAEGIPCGREPNGSLLSSREGGLICVKTPDASDLAWVIADFNAVWDAAVIGDIVATTDAVAATVASVAGIIMNDDVTDQRINLHSRSDIEIADGTVITVGYTDRWSILWSNCSSSPQAAGLDPTP